MRTSVHTAIILVTLAILAAAAVSLRAAQTAHGPVHERRPVQQVTSDPRDVPDIGGFH